MTTLNIFNFNPDNIFFNTIIFNELHFHNKFLWNLNQIFYLKLNFLEEFNNNFQKTNFNYLKSLNDYTLFNYTQSLDILHVSIPNIKLYYPEPFIASPTYIHEDIWFLHIVIYQYWLWFFFIFMIVFFFLAFLITVRWCNIRNRPVRETRGVSRSKCGDLITATVPVSWAASIIIHESTDAIEISDGFGSSEMAVGIRAYQWGWEYYYPKSLNLFFNESKSMYNFGHSFINNNETNEWNNQYFFKKNSILNELTDNTPTSFFHLIGNFNNKLPLDSTVNKLVSSKSTNLITNQKILNLKTTSDKLINKNTSFIHTTFNRYFNKFELNTSVPVINNNQQLFLPKTSQFKNSLYFNNLKLKENGEIVQIYINLFKNLNSNQMLNSFNKLHTSKNNLLNNKTISNLNENKLIKNIIKINMNHNIEKLSSTSTKLQLLQKNWILLNTSSNYNMTTISDQDFKIWDNIEMIEDVNYDLNLNQNNLITAKIYSLIKNPIKSYKESVLFNRDIPNPKMFYINYNSLVFLNTKWNDFNFKYLNKNSEYEYLINRFFLIGLLNNSHNLIKSYYIKNINSEFNYLINTKDLFISKNLYSTLMGWINNKPYVLNQNLEYNLNEQAATNYLENFNLNDILKNFNSTEQAFWKVFKNNIDEERGGFNIKLFSNLNYNLPFVNSKAPSTLTLFAKNNLINYTNTLIFQKKISNNSQSTINSNLNFYSNPFPFSISSESDISRYTWFDWYSLKSLRVTKAIDTSVFNLYGAKQFNFSFSKDPNVTLINRLDNFFVKYTHARKLYLPINTYAPYFYEKYNDWIKFNAIKLMKLDNNLNEFDKITNFEKSLILSNWIWLYNFKESNKHFFKFNFSANYTPARPYYNFSDTTSIRGDFVAQLIDTLNKKEFLYYLYGSQNDVLNLNFKNKSAIYNPLLLSINESNSYLENKFYKNLNSSVKSQYQPMRKGIVNMIRIQSDKAVAMPTDTRLQILAVSKDIIHSWSIPSAGIKIDCIPGYSSHRIALFTLSGIYWGQCMEICGRFHHWMPIVVYFIRRDLFCIWCTHFIFNNHNSNYSKIITTSLYSNQSNNNTFYNLWIYEL